MKRQSRPIPPFQPPVFGRIDALRDLKQAIQWKWKGVGVSPEAVVKPRAVEIDGRRVGLYWPEKGWGTTRLWMLCPLCGGRSRFLYELPDGGLGCHEHVSGERKRKEAALDKLRRARVKQKSRKHVAHGRLLEAQAWHELNNLTLAGLDSTLKWAKREIGQR